MSDATVVARDMLDAIGAPPLPPGVVTLLAATVDRNVGMVRTSPPEFPTRTDLVEDEDGDLQPVRLTDEQYAAAMERFKRDLADYQRTGGFLLREGRPVATVTARMRDGSAATLTWGSGEPTWVELKREW